jgi:hypothetical protein
MPKYTNGLMLMATHNLVMTPPKQGHFDTLNIPTTPSPISISAPSSNTDEAAKLRQQKLLDSFEQERQAKEKIQKDLAQKKEKLNQTCIQAKDYLRKLKVGGHLYFRCTRQ